MSVISDCSKRLIRSGLNNDTFARSKEAGNACAFGKRWIHSKSKDIISWNIKFNKLDAKHAVGVGLVSNKHKQELNSMFKQDHSYFYSPQGVFAVDGKWISTTNDVDFKFESGDILTIVLNMETTTLSVYKNSNKDDTRIIYEDVKTSDDIKYRFALWLGMSGGNSVSITTNEILRGKEETKTPEKEVWFIYPLR